ncbi:MAG: ABC transporter ATP-binding protein [Lachnospiraceae bacterium]|jgi:ATP-binding cassette subfamily B protein|nr:ABC transporter ATP-binding protein [Lachnospiraceae bacterium]MDO4407822.1 ABC transporter ATP-binding protein [Eubacteriales bacterium]
MAEKEKVKVVGGGPRGMRGRPRPKVENPGKLLRRIFSYVFRYYGLHLILVAVCIVVSVFANVQGTMFTRTLIDKYILPMVEQVKAGQGSPDFSPLLRAMARVACFYLVGIGSAYLQARTMAFVTQGTMKHMRTELFDHMESLPIKYFDTHAHGDIMSVYTNDIDTLRQMISQSMPQLLNSTITIVSIFSMMLVLSPPLTAVSMVMVIVMLLSSGKVTSLSGRNFVAQQRNLGKLNGFIEETMTGEKVVKVFSHEQQVIREFDQLNEELYQSSARANGFANIIGPVNGQLGNTNYVICAIVGGVLAVNSYAGFTVGALASFLTLNRGFSMPINQVSMQFNSIIMALAGAERIFRLMDEKPETDEGYVMLVNCRQDENGEIVEAGEHTGQWAWKHYHKAEDTTTYQRLEGDITFNGVDFGYRDDKMVLHDIWIHAKPGMKIALVGSTGAGKTTITNLINRFYDIQDGKIRYDNINVNKIKKGDLRRSLGIVLQDTHLFTGTVSENIRFGKLDATEEEIVRAAKLANADGFIRRLPKGYDTMLTGDGANLSQGQRQLLAIARAAIADPPALILDEATSSIDTRTEKIVQAGMDQLMKGRTTFVIAHRLSTIRNSDLIIVLEQGRIVEQGTHEELLALGKRYYQLYTGKKPELAS